LDKDILIDDDTIVSWTITLEDGSPSPSWITMEYPSVSTNNMFKFSGTFPEISHQVINFKINAVDSNGLQGSAIFTLETKGKVYSFNHV